MKQLIQNSLRNIFSWRKNKKTFQMEAWSDSTVHGNFKVSFYLDTNILSYLVDKSFSGLNACFEFLSDCDLVDLKSSRYVIFEYVGIRKREHYLRRILQRNTNQETGTVNLSSLLLYKESFKSQDVDFKVAMAEISDVVINGELNKIVNEFKISFEGTEIHSELWRPTFDLLLQTRISREDSLVTMSSAFPLRLTKEEGAYILTNDKGFVEAYKDQDLAEEIDAVFSNHEIKKPELIHIDNLNCNGSTVNLTRREDDPRVLALSKHKVLDCILTRNRPGFMGLTINVPRNAPRNTICFELPADSILSGNQYIVFVSKEVDFIYTSRIRISEFMDNMVPVIHPFTANESRRLSFLLTDLAADGAITEVPQNVLDRLREPGHWIFIHPDSDL